MNGNFVWWGSSERANEEGKENSNNGIIKKTNLNPY